MTTTSPDTASTRIQVLDVDQAFPAMVDRSGGRTSAAASGADQTPQVRSVLRDVLGLRTRTEDPNAFVNALTAAFQLRHVEGHTEARYVPRGYAVNADLGAVTGGQASLYRRAQVFRTEMLRILDGLTPLRTDADTDDLDAYRSLVRGAVINIVDELGAAGGPRLELVDSYLLSLTGSRTLGEASTPDTVAGQLGALRERFGLVDQFVNTVEEEGVRTSFWTLADMINDLQGAWAGQRDSFGGSAGSGFLGTELILLSRLMEAAADQVEELEDVLDSVLVPVSERRTLILDEQTGLTLDGLLGWLRNFLTTEGRRLAQDSGRDGIVSALTPVAISLVKVFTATLADRLSAEEELGHGTIRYLPASCCAPLPAGLYAARTKIAVAGLCRLLLRLAKTAQRIGRWPGVVLLNVAAHPFATRDDMAEVVVRGLNFRSSLIPAFVDPAVPIADGCHIEEIDEASLVYAVRGSTTGDTDRLAGVFQTSKITKFFGNAEIGTGLTVAAQDVPMVVIDGETGRVVLAPQTTTFPDLQPAATPSVLKNPARAWHSLPDDESRRFVPDAAVPRDLSPDAEQLDDVGAALGPVGALYERREELQQRRSEAAAQLSGAQAIHAKVEVLVGSARAAAQRSLGAQQHLQALADSHEKVRYLQDAAEEAGAAHDLDLAAQRKAEDELGDRYTDVITAQAIVDSIDDQLNAIGFDIDNQVRGAIDAATTTA